MIKILIFNQCINTNPITCIIFLILSKGKESVCAKEEIAQLDTKRKSSDAFLSDVAVYVHNLSIPSYATKVAPAKGIAPKNSKKIVNMCCDQYHKLY